MKINTIYNTRAQAVVEMAIFGSLMLLGFAFLLSYLQSSNDRQYVQMESFRRALQKANTGLGVATEGAGASVQLTLIQNRRQSDISDNFRKGSSQTFNASSSVFWAVPKVGAPTADNVLVFRVNDDEQAIINNPNVKLEDINSNQSTNFSEASTKQETPQAIINTRTSQLTDTISTSFLDDAGNPIWQVTQGAYRDSNGQYRYSSSQVGNEIDRGKSWSTGF